MSFSNFPFSVDNTIEFAPLAVQLPAKNIHIQQHASNSTRSSTSSEDQSPDRFNSDAFYSDKESSIVESLVIAHKAKSVPGTLSVSDSSDNNNFEIEYDFFCVRKYHLI